MTLTNGGTSSASTTIDLSSALGQTMLATGGTGSTTGDFQIYNSPAGTDWNRFSTANYQDNYRNIWSTLKALGSNLDIDWSDAQGNLEFASFQVENSLTCIKAEVVASNLLNSVILNYDKDNPVRIREAIDENESVENFSKEISVINGVLNQLNVVIRKDLYVPNLKFRKEFISKYNKLLPVFEYIKGGKENIAIGITLLSEIGNE